MGYCAEKFPEVSCVATHELPSKNPSVLPLPLGILPLPLWPPGIAGTQRPGLEIHNRVGMCTLATYN